MYTVESSIYTVESCHWHPIWPYESYIMIIFLPSALGLLECTKELRSLENVVEQNEKKVLLKL